MTAPSSYQARTDAEASVASVLMQLIGPIVDHPDRVRVYTVSDDDNLNFVAQLAADDLGKFLGSQARTARSLRVIVRALGTKAQRRFSLSFEERPSTPASEPKP